MSEIKGQLLGIILVLMVFGTVATAVTIIFNNLTNKVQEQVEKVGSSSAATSAYITSELMSY